MRAVSAPLNAPSPSRRDSRRSRSCPRNCPSRSSVSASSARRDHVTRDEPCQARHRQPARAPLVKRGQQAQQAQILDEHKSHRDHDERRQRRHGCHALGRSRHKLARFRIEATRRDFAIGKAQKVAGIVYVAGMGAEAGQRPAGRWAMIVKLR